MLNTKRNYRFMSEELNTPSGPESQPAKLTPNAQSVKDGLTKIPRKAVLVPPAAEFGVSVKQRLAEIAKQSVASHALSSGVCKTGKICWCNQSKVLGLLVLATRRDHKLHGLGLPALEFSTVSNRRILTFLLAKNAFKI